MLKIGNLKRTPLEKDIVLRLMTGLLERDYRDQGSLVSNIAKKRTMSSRGWVDPVP